MMVNEIRELMFSAVKDVDITAPIEFIKLKLIERKARFMPEHYRGHVMSEHENFLTQEQAVKLEREGFAIEKLYETSGLGNERRHNGYMVSW